MAMPESGRFPWDQAIAMLYCGDDERQWTVASVRVPEPHRGQGMGSKIMAMVIEDADREGVVLDLVINPGLNGLDEHALKAWYERLGFVETTQWAMRREPL
jgi:GNAT superfamily N-acetyltransferase